MIEKETRSFRGLMNISQIFFKVLSTIGQYSEHVFSTYSLGKIRLGPGRMRDLWVSHPVQRGGEG